MNFRFSIRKARPLVESPVVASHPLRGIRRSNFRSRSTPSLPTDGANTYLNPQSAIRNPQSPDGFTLIELLIVIAIIAILAALTLNTAGFIQKKAARSRAETEIAALSAALESYKADNGDYPGGTNTSTTGDNSFLRAALSPASGKVYFEFSKTMGDDLTTNGKIIDPFGENYLYQYPGNVNRSGTNFFDLWSQSAAGSTKSNLWIKNW